MRTVVLDAMIKRADFAQQTEGKNIELFDKFTLSMLKSDDAILRMLRKPDFQRETNHWKPEQISTFISSFANGELIPSLILWKSDAHIFIIDGAHRLSALRAWINNDYGDGVISHDFFGGKIQTPQKTIAEKTRKAVENRVARYSDLRSIYEDDNTGNSDLQSIASTVFTKAIPVQWIQGSQEVAEVSFFKINSQGTPLDSTEELLLKNRKKANAIAARSIVRAGTGHKYWSDFDDTIQKEITEIAEELYELLFQPDLDEPIKTLDLPLGGTVSPLDAYKMMLDLFSVVENAEIPEKSLPTMEVDEDGSKTISILKKSRKVIRRITSSKPESLGLHNAVYFYNHLGKHSGYLFLGVLKFASDAVRKNNKKYFIQFTNNREKVEKTLIRKKSIINQALANVNSRQRIERINDLMTGLVNDAESGNPITDKIILSHLGLEGKVSSVAVIEKSKSISKSTKSQTYLKESLGKALKCPHCKGLLDPKKAITYDHKKPKRDGGTGELKNVQIMHPFCNSGMKS